MKCVPPFFYGHRIAIGDNTDEIAVFWLFPGDKSLFLAWQWQRSRCNDDVNDNDDDDDDDDE